MQHRAIHPTEGSYAQALGIYDEAWLLEIKAIA